MMNHTDEQVNVAHSRANRLLVNALAGTGKTETIAYRCMELIAAGTKPSKILLLSFTRSGRDALTARLNALQVVGVEVRTIDSFARELYQEIFGKLPKVSDSDRLFEYSLNDLDAHRYFTPMDLKRMASWASNEGIVEVPSDAAHLVPPLLERYEYYKSRFGVMDFDDLMRAVSEIATPSFEEVILDEAQDMKRWHREFIEAISRKRITLVGDPNQSIYGFAGISAHALDVGDEWTTLPLSKSFRSKQELLLMPNALLDLNMTSDMKGGTVRVHHDVKQSPNTIADAVVANDVEAVLVRTRYEGELIARALMRQGVSVGRSWADRDGGRVYVSTVHASKGLEWERVLIAGVGEEGWRRATNSDDEERRLFYVALTRARDSVDIFHFNGMPWGLS